jgi:hypothetical protein
MGKLCSKTWVRGIYSTHRTATERENLGIWARDSLATREGTLRRRERERRGARYGLYAINPIVYLVLLESNYG